MCSFFDSSILQFSNSPSLTFQRRGLFRGVVVFSRSGGDGIPADARNRHWMRRGLRGTQTCSELETMTMALHERIVYGPVRSRRLGSSLGINLLPPGAKVCNMNCAYCQYGWTRGPTRYRGQGGGWPTPQAVAAAVEDRLVRAEGNGELIDRITVAGHGEPTLHPEFAEISARLVEVRDRIAPGIRLAVLSNSTTAGVADVRRGLACYDDRYMKLDAGDPVTYARLNGGGSTLAKIVDGLRSLPSIVQSMFVTDAAHQIDNATEAAVAAWLRTIQSICATAVHIYTLDRAPALGVLQPVPRRRLREIAEHVRAAGIRAEVFPARSTSISRLQESV
jgi:wyosine [tRNA(Phe)-imidazoG37] synthetase (radical SAM superfamily)